MGLPQHRGSGTATLGNHHYFATDLGAVRVAVFRVHGLPTAATF